MKQTKRKLTKLAKEGNVFIPIGIIVLVVIFATIFLVYYQLNVIVENVRCDLFYASKNAILSFDLQDLAYKNYTVYENKAKEIIEYILNKNYTQNSGSITKIQIIELDIENKKDKVKLKIQVEVTFNSVINIMGNKRHSFRMNEDIKISLMDFTKGNGE